MAPPRSPANTHRIGSLRFEVTGASEAALLELRTTIEKATETALPAALSDVLDEAAGPDEVLEITRLEVDLGSLDANGFDPQVLAAATQRALVRITRPPPQRGGAGAAPDTSEAPLAAEATAAAGVRRRPVALATLDAIIAYILTGDPGTDAPARDVEVLFAALAPSAATGARLLAAIREAPPSLRRAAVLRLITFVSPPVLAAMLAPEATATFARHGDAASLARDLEAARRSMTVLEAFVDRLLPLLLAESEPVPPVPTRQRADRRTAAQADQVIEFGTSAPNAGVVLLHPFLPRLFGFCDLVEEGRFRGTAARATAARLVHYLATGEASAPEPALAIPRLLCAVPPEVPLLPLEPLAAALCDKGDALLDAAIAHWRKLGRTSPQGLRETFLMRPGLIKGPPERRRLVVERRGVDVLLGALPWALDPVRLPWLRAPIAVDWA